MSLFALVLAAVGATLALGVRGRRRRAGDPIAAVAVALPSLLLMALLATLLGGAVSNHRFDGLRVVLEGVSVDLAALRDRPITLGGDPALDTLVAEGAPAQAVRLTLDGSGRPALTVSPPASGAPEGLIQIDGHAPGAEPTPLDPSGRATKLRFFRADSRGPGEPPRLVEKRSLDLIVRDGRVGVLLDTPAVERISGDQFARALDLRRKAGFDTVVLNFSSPSAGGVRALSGLPFKVLGDRARADLSGRIEIGGGRGAFQVFDGRGQAATAFGRAFSLGGDLAALARIDRIDLGWSAYRNLTWLPFATLILTLLGTWSLRRASAVGFLLLSLLDLLLVLRLIVAVEGAYVSDAARVTLAVHDALVALLAAPVLIAALAPVDLDRRVRFWHGGLVLLALLAMAMARQLSGGGEHAFGRAPSFGEMFGATGAVCFALGLAAVLRLAPGRPLERIWTALRPWVARAAAVAAGAGDRAQTWIVRRMTALADARLDALGPWLRDPRNPWAPIALLAGLGLVRISLLAVHVREAAHLPGLRLPLSAIHTPLALGLFAWALIRLGRRTAEPRGRFAALTVPALWGAWTLALVVAPLAVRDSGYLLTNGGPFLLWAGFAALAATSLPRTDRIALAAPGLLAVVAYLVLALHAQWVDPRPDLIAQAARAPTSPEAHRVLSDFAAQAGNRLRLEAVFDPEALSSRGSADALRDRDVIAHRTAYADSWTGRGWLALDRPTLLDKTQLDDDLSEIHILSPFGRTGGAALLAVEGLVAALLSFAMLRRCEGDVVRASLGVSLGLLCVWTLFFVSAYMVLGAVGIVPFTGRDVYLLAAASPSDLFEGLALFGLAFGLLLREEAAWRG